MRRHHHKKKGRFAVFSTVAMIAAYFGLALALSIKGSPHPLLAVWGQITQLTFHSIVYGVVLICLFQFYRGSISVKQVMGVAALLASVGLTVLLTFSFVQDNLSPWTVFEGGGLLLGIYVTWVCLFSRRVSSFMSYQQDHH